VRKGREGEVVMLDFVIPEFAAFPDMITTGRFFDGPLTAEHQVQIVEAAKVCISCGAHQSIDGDLPCGH
jgi:hypothetical protein